jgi:multimeric flavodoxin WrbA
MKVLLVNGSPREKGCTYTALCEVDSALEKNGVQSEIFHIGAGAQQGCVACFKCREIDKCVFDDKIYDELSAKMTAADGIVIGSPVYYAGPNGSLCALLDRVFFSSGDNFYHKPAAAVVSCRRGGASSAFDRLNKYFTISQMPVVTSQYWNSVHGHTPDEVRLDLEGLQVMRVLRNNMAWLLKSIESGSPPPASEEKRVFTNFIGKK